MPKHVPKKSTKALSDIQKNVHDVFNWGYNFDSWNAQGATVGQDLSRIEMIPIKRGAEATHKCEPENYATVHWSTYITENDHLVEDTRKKFGDSHPEVI